jgi:hypothetical protein
MHNQRQFSTVGGNATKSDHLTKVEEINQILKIYHSEY